MVQALYEQLRRELLRQDIVNVDETRVHVLKEDGRESSQMSQMWVFCSAEKKIALYQYSPSRSGRVAKEMLQGFSGYTQTDGYSGYNCLDSVTHVGCWAHARRKWVECFVDGKPVQGSRSEAVFHLIEEMFSLEQAWKDQSPEARFTLRQEKLRPLLDSYWELLDSFEAAEGTALSKAKAYSLNQKQALNAVLLDGRLELTNNLAERTVKPFVMARKNFLFCDTAKGADASALCFSVIETAKRNGLDPFGYLLFLLQELPKLGENPTEEQLVPLLPWAESLPSIANSNNFNRFELLMGALFFIPHGGLLNAYSFTAREGEITAWWVPPARAKALVPGWQPGCGMSPEARSGWMGWRFTTSFWAEKKQETFFQISCSVCRCVGGGYLVIKVRGKLTRCVWNSKLGAVFINQYLYHTYHQQVQYWHYAFLQVPKTAHYLLKHFP